MSAQTSSDSVFVLETESNYKPNTSLSLSVSQTEVSETERKGRERDWKEREV